MAERKTKATQSYKEDWTFSARGVLLDVQGDTPAFLSTHDRSQEQQTVLRPHGQTEIQTSEPLTPEQILTAEKEFLDDLDDFRRENGLPTLTRLEVTDTTAAIQTGYLITLNPVILTHVTPFEYLDAHYPEEAQTAEILDDVRTRGRAKLASTVVGRFPPDNYAERGGVLDLLVAGTSESTVALNALLDSPYHRPPLEDPDNIQCGVFLAKSGAEDEPGVAVWTVVLGKGIEGHHWEESERGETEKPHKMFLPGVFN